MPNLSFVKKIHEHDDIYTFYFEKPKHLNHTAGQHGLFILPGLYRPHPFSLSSAPEEEFVTFTTHIRETSRYKQRLMQLKPGNTIILLGPILNFTLPQNAKDIVFLAQGIGITPFRSMLVHAHEAKLPVDITLIHVDKTPHTFEAVIKDYARQAYFPITADDFRNLLTKQPSKSTFYLSGSPTFVRSTKEALKAHGVVQMNIKTDSFLGY